jgi:hypothetical protein
MVRRNGEGGVGVSFGCKVLGYRNCKFSKFVINKFIFFILGCLNFVGVFVNCFLKKENRVGKINN